MAPHKDLIDFFSRRSEDVILEKPLDGGDMVIKTGDL